jgi:hypothetical protein
MEFLANTWIVWLALCVGCLGGVLLYRRGKRKETSFFVTAQDLSTRTLMLDIRKGDGDIFLGFLLSMVFFSLFVAGLVHWLRNIF